MMRKALIFQHKIPAGYLTEAEDKYVFEYLPDYQGTSISLTLPVRKEPYIFESFPTFFDGLLPEGYQLESLLKRHKIDRNDSFSQLVAVGADTVGSVTAQEVSE